MASKKKGKSKKKKGSIIVRLVSTAPGSTHTRTARRSTRMEKGPQGNGKLTGLKKYDPTANGHFEYVEKKIK